MGAQGFEDQVVGALACRMRRAHFMQDEVIYRRGEPAKEMYLVLSGEASSLPAPPSLSLFLCLSVSLSLHLFILPTLSLSFARSGCGMTGAWRRRSSKRRSR